MSPLKGWRKIPGKSERYKPPDSYDGPTGPNGTVSRRQYENYRMRQYGWRSWAEYQHDANTDDYRRWKGEYAANQKGQPEGSYRGPHSEFAEYYLRAKRSGWSKDANGPLADLLILTGHREPEWEWDVGDTNFQ